MADQGVAQTSVSLSVGQSFRHMIRTSDEPDHPIVQKRERHAGSQAHAARGSSFCWFWFFFWRSPGVLIDFLEDFALLPQP
jgi:hypothetical protein